MSEIWWYLSRSSGIVATVLIVAALVCGLRFSARATGTKHRPKWWLDLHNYLGGLAFAFVVVHIVAVYQDELSGIGLLQILVPMTAPGWAWGISWGVIATYGFALVVFTSWPRKRGSRRVWLAIHLMSVPAAVLAGVHAWMVGSSRGQLWFAALARCARRRRRLPGGAPPVPRCGEAPDPSRVRPAVGAAGTGHDSLANHRRGQARPRRYRTPTAMIAIGATAVAGTRRVEDHMGTVVSLHAVEAPDHAVDAFFDEIRHLEAKLTRFRDDSEVMRLERGELAFDDASAQVREVIVRCEFLRTMTDGAFDHRPIIRGRRSLDPNAFAKGWIIEQALLHLQFAGVSQYFVNAGGDVVAGAGPTGRPSWSVGITHPDDPASTFATVDLDRAAIATSGRYERGDHIRSTASRVRHDELTSVSVVGPELATADALATAVLAGGETRPEWWPRDCPYGIIALRASGRVAYTENLADSVRFE